MLPRFANWNVQHVRQLKEMAHIPGVQCPRYQEMKKTDRWVFSEKTVSYDKHTQALT